MAIHTDLPVYKLCRDLLRAASQLTRNMPRDYKATLGRRLFGECVDTLVLIQRANAAVNKLAHLDELLEHVGVIETLLRLALDERLISPRQYATGADICTRAGRQINGWRNWTKARPINTSAASAA